MLGIMDYDLTGTKTEGFIDLGEQAGATDYLTRPTAKAYLNEDPFGIKVLGLLHELLRLS